MTFEEYKKKLDKIREDTKYHSASRMWMNHPLFEELVNDPDAKKHIHELLIYEPSWQLYSIVMRVYPDLSIQDHHAGRFKEVGYDMLNWIEEHA